MEPTDTYSAVDAELDKRIEPLMKAGQTRTQAIQKVFATDEEFRQRYVKEKNRRK